MCLAIAILGFLRIEIAIETTLKTAIVIYRPMLEDDNTMGIIPYPMPSVTPSLMGKSQGKSTASCQFGDNTPGNTVTV